MTPLDISKNVFGQVRAISGWLSFDAIYASCLLVSAQNELRKQPANATTAEIGVHHGKYFVAFNSLYAGLLPAARINSLAMDLFAAQELNLDKSGKGDKSIFTKNVSTHLPARVNMDILQGNSMEFSAENFRSTGMLDFASIDGGHHYDCVRSDIKLISSVMKEGGIVSLDDFYHPGWAEVSIAYLHSAGTDLQPLVLAGGKLFLIKDSSTTRELYRQYLEWLLKEFAISESYAVNVRKIGRHLVETKLQAFLGSEIVYLITYDQRPLIRLIRGLLRRMQIQ